jgi:SAM-dependent methyltransferase
VTEGLSLRHRAGAQLDRRLSLLVPTRRLRFARAIAALRRLPSHAPLRVLDAGCGEGILAQEVAERRPNWFVLGVDVNEELLERARARTRAIGLPNAAFRRADLTEGLDSAEFDVVAAIQCLEEIAADERALAVMVQALKPGGLFVGQVPQRDWKPVLRGADPTWRHEVRHGYGTQELVSMLEQSGLVDVVTHPADHALIRLAQELRDRLKQRTIGVRALIHPLLLAATLLELAGLRLGKPRSIFITANRRADHTNADNERATGCGVPGPRRE